MDDANIKWGNYQHWLAELPEILARDDWDDNIDLQMVCLGWAAQLGQWLSSDKVAEAQRMVQERLGLDKDRFSKLLELDSIREQRRALKVASDNLVYERLPGEDIYPNDDSWLARYMRYNQGNEVPPNWNFWCGVGVLAASLRRNLYVDMGNHEMWPNLYLVIVADTAARKSTAINTACAILSRANKIMALRGITPEKHIYVSPQRCTPESFLNQIRDQELNFTNGDKRWDQARRKACGIVRADELVTLLGKNTHNAGGWVELLTALYDSQESWVDSTISRGECILNEVALSFMVGSTADWIRDGVTESIFAGGFMGRCMFVTRPVNEREIPRPSPLDPINANELAEELIRNSIMATREFQVTKDWIAFHADWYHANKAQIREAGDRRMAFYYSRKEQHILKLSMLLAVSEGRFWGEARDLELANKCLTLEEHYLPMIFNQMIESRGSQHITKACEFLKGADGLLQHSKLLKKMVHYVGDAGGFKELIRTMTGMGIIKTHINKTGKVEYELLKED